MMRDRIKAGLARARAQGKRLGRPPVPPEVEQAIRDARAEGKGMLKIGRELGVGIDALRHPPPGSKSPTGCAS